MTSEKLRTCVWQSLIAAQTRAVYYGELASVMHVKERWAAFAVSICSTLAFVNLLSKLQVPFLSEAFSLLSAVAGAYVGLMQRNKTASMACTLCRSWSEIQVNLELLWLQMRTLDDEVILERWHGIEKSGHNATETAPVLGRLKRKLLLQSQMQVFRLRGINATST